MSELAYTISIMPLPTEDGGGYLAFAPDLQGCVADGETPMEAVEDLMHAIEAWAAMQEKRGRKMPAPGTSAAYALQMREEAQTLLKKQGELIAEQTRLILALSEEVKALKSLRVGSAFYTQVMGAESGWTMHPTAGAVVAMPVQKQRDRKPA